MQDAQTWRQAEVDYQAGRHEIARTSLMQLTQRPAAAPWAHLRLASMALSGGQLQEATAQVLMAQAAAYADDALLMQLCRSLLALGERRAALAVAHALVSLARVQPSILIEAGKLLSDHMEPVVALRLLARARAMGCRDSAGLLYLEGLNHMYLGDLALAQESLQRSLAIDPEFTPTYWGLAKLRVEDGRNGRIDQLRRMLSSRGDADTDAALLGYSLFQELDATDDIKSAWDVLQRAMQARRAQVCYDEGAQHRLCEHLRERMYDLGAYEPGLQQSAEDAPSPILIVGMPRTGTTVVEQSLCAAFSLESAGELREFLQQMRWCADLPGAAHPDMDLLSRLEAIGLQDVGHRYLQHTQWRAGHSPHYCDKWPENYLVMGYALATISSARVVVVNRDPMDSCWSNIKEWFGASYYYSYDLAETARQYARWRTLQAVAREEFGDRVIAVDYESFVADPEHQVRMVGHALSLKPRQSISNVAGVVATASAAQVRDSITTKHIGSWKRYEHWLDPLRKALEEAGVQPEAAQ